MLVITLKGSFEGLHKIVILDISGEGDFLVGVLVRALEVDVRVKVLLPAVQHVDHFN